MISVGIIEDQADYRNVLEVLINHTQGMTVAFSAASAEEAMQLLVPAQPTVCMVDINLPGKPGPELVRWIRQQIPATLCIMCTAYDEDENVFTSLEAGAQGYILKSTSPADIISAIVELHSGGSPMSSQVARKVVSSFKKDNNDKVSGLTSRENDLLLLLAQGLLYKEIAEQLDISIATVKRHCFNIYQKLHVKNRTEAINKLH